MGTSPINIKNLNRQSPTTSNNSNKSESEEDNACGIDLNNSMKVEVGDTNKSYIDTNKATEEMSKLSLESKNVTDSNKPKTGAKSREGHLTKLSQNLENFSKKINSSDSQKSKELDKSGKSTKYTVVNKRLSDVPGQLDNKENDDSNREGNNIHY